jgi:hypothetical protein
MRLLAAALSLLLAAAVIHAGEAKPKRRKPTGKVITNADVKKSKGTLIENKNAAAPAPVEKTPGMVELHEAARKTRIEHTEKVAALEAKLALFEAELVKLERAYFEENDPATRDGAIAKRFDVVRADRDAVKSELVELQKTD